MQKEYQDLLDSTQEYIRLRYDWLRLELLEKLSLIIALLLIFLVSTILGLVIITYASVLLLVWLETLFGSMIPGLCIVIGIHLIALACIFIFRKQWFINPLIRHLSKIIFSETNTAEASATDSQASSNSKEEVPHE